jgi:hypothetical protein
MLVKMQLLWDFKDKLLIEHSVMTLEGIPERSFTKWIGSHLNRSSHLAAIKQRIFPIYWSAISFSNNEEAMGSCSHHFLKARIIFIKFDFLFVFYFNHLTLGSQLVFHLRIVLLKSHLVQLLQQLLYFGLLILD